MSTHYGENNASILIDWVKVSCYSLLPFVLNNMQSYVMCYMQKLQFDIRFAM